MVETVIAYEPDAAEAGQELYVALAHHEDGSVVVAGVFTSRRLADIGSFAYRKESVDVPGARGPAQRVAIHISSLNEHGLGPEIT